ncbi:phenylalanyl-tRNA synthetase beta chain [Lasiosphaeria hispida]|uniref:phenylalanine--tRNA ligase n=1 Tax=Lasiosphaeria hispida TaxID=260671 RepID=A0AAJ0HQL9_9PEZI|nr:phenylalanyl-tRNA synthetase beta chain [Lasiosphaeria hispida]
MPTINVDKYALFEELGQHFTADEFQELCFDFGIELDKDTEDDPARPKDQAPELAIEIPANRYDMLCFEGIALHLNIFRGKQATPNYKLLGIPESEMQSITVTKATAEVRPYVAGAILRNLKFTPATYASFIGLQDKLHQNLARQRTLVSIGTHDLDTIQGPFTYDALPPKDINFIPLNQTKKMNGEELMAFYEADKHLGRFLHIIRDKPVYPVIFDANKTVCSLPPIINGDYSKITLETTNVFIEITATDQTKLDIVCNIMVAMFSRYCEEAFTIEPVKIISEHNGTTRVTPSLATRVMDVEVDYINKCCGLEESPAGICKLLGKMALAAEPSEDPKFVKVQVPSTRADVLHACDVMEDVAIGYGFNKLPRLSPNKTATIGKPLPINKLGDIVRHECAMAGWIEVMPLILCAHEENFEWLNRVDDGTTAIKLANPKSVEYQVVRTSLLPGLLKTLRENKSVRLPLQIVEVADIAVKDESLERKSRNERRWAAAFYGKTSGFEVVHGLLDRVLSMLRVAFITREEGLDGGKSMDFEVKQNPSEADGYFIEEINEPTFFNGRAAAIYVRLGGKVQRIGEFGVLHPTVLEKFDLRYPVSTLEVNLEVFL